MTVYSITMDELIRRPIIRDDNEMEWMNKLTDDEINQRYIEIAKIYEESENLGGSTLHTFQLDRFIDTDILYKMFNIAEVHDIIKSENK